MELQVTFNAHQTPCWHTPYPQAAVALRQVSEVIKDGLY